MITGGARRVGAQIAHAPAAIVAAALREFGHIDILINNASVFYPTPVGQISAAQWDDLFCSNVKAPLFLAQAAAPSLRERRGLIINMVDIHGLRPLRGHLVYSAAKAPRSRWRSSSGRKSASMASLRVPYYGRRAQWMMR